MTTSNGLGAQPRLPYDPSKPQFEMRTSTQGTNRIRLSNVVGDVVFATHPHVTDVLIRGYGDQRQLDGLEVLDALARDLYGLSISGNALLEDARQVDVDHDGVSINGYEVDLTRRAVLILVIPQQTTVVLNHVFGTVLVEGMLDGTLSIKAEQAFILSAQTVRRTALALSGDASVKIGAVLEDAIPVLSGDAYLEIGRMDPTQIEFQRRIADSAMAFINHRIYTR